MEDVGERGPDADEVAVRNLAVEDASAPRQNETVVRRIEPEAREQQVGDRRCHDDKGGPVDRVFGSPDVYRRGVDQVRDTLIRAAVGQGYVLVDERLPLIAVPGSVVDGGLHHPGQSFRRPGEGYPVLLRDWAKRYASK